MAMAMLSSNGSYESSVKHDHRQGFGPASHRDIRYKK